jgi:hypothetical protein
VREQCGITNLARRLNQLLVEHIKALLPSLRRAINDSLEVELTGGSGLSSGQLHSLFPDICLGRACAGSCG